MDFRYRKNAIRYGSLPFWSWNDKLQEDELRRQIRRMHDLGMNGFFMHARGGLETEYLSDEWYELTRACVDEAKKLGMEAWAYDENGWPSGFAGSVTVSTEYGRISDEKESTSYLQRTYRSRLAMGVGGRCLRNALHLPCCGEILSGI